LDTVIVIGLGNPILSDDSVGLVAVREARRRLAGRPPGPATPPAGEGEAAEVVVTPDPGRPPIGLVFAEVAVGGLDLVDLLSGHAGAVLVDAAVTHQAEPGEVFEVDLSFLEDTTHLGTAGLAHQVDLGTAWRLGRRLGLGLPRHLRILAVEAADVKTFSEALSPAVARNLEAIVTAVVETVTEVAGEVAGGTAQAASDDPGGEGSESPRTNSP